MPLATVKYLFSTLLPKYRFFPLETFMAKTIIGHFYLIVACDNMCKIVALYIIALYLHVSFQQNSVEYINKFLSYYQP